MKKLSRKLLSIVLAAAFLTLTPIHLSAEPADSLRLTDSDFLHTDGRYLKNENGEIVTLRGTNLGGWLHLEGWMDGGGSTFLFQTKAKQNNWSVYINDQFDTTAKTAMVDGDVDTLWNDVGANYSKITIWLGGETTFDSVFLDCQGTAENAYTGALRLSYFDGTSWQALQTVNGNSTRTFFGSFGTITSEWVCVERLDAGAVWSVSEFRLAEYTMMNDYNVRTALYDAFTQTQADTLLNIYQNAYFTEADLDYIAGLGMNYVRVPVYWMELMNTDGTMKYSAFDQLDWIVEMCSNKGMYVIIDLHGTPGGHSGGFSTGGQTGSNELWTNGTYQDWVVTIWQVIANRYKTNPSVAGYELLNEPAQFTQSNEVIINFYSRLYNAIRAIDSRHIIIMSALYDKHYDATFGIDVQNYNDFASLGSPASRGWTNVMYDSHHYLPEKTDRESQIAFANQQLQHLEFWSNAYNMPLLVGECNFYGQNDAWTTFLSGLNEKSISWSNWSYKNTSADWTTSFALRYSFTGQQAVFQDDSYDVLAAKLGAYMTTNYSQTHVTLAALLSTYASA